MPAKTSHGGTDKPAVDENRIRPIDHDRGLRLRVSGERVGERRHARIERAARLQQRFVGLEHHGKFGKIEASDIDQRAGAFFRSNRHRVGKCVADFAQTYGGEWRRQCQFRREARLRTGRLKRHRSSLYHSL
jgi:hypothetical protein